MAVIESGGYACAAASVCHVCYTWNHEKEHGL